MYISLKLKMSSIAEAIFASHIETGVHHKSARFKLLLICSYDSDGDLRSVGQPSH